MAHEKSTLGDLVFELSRGNESRLNEEAQRSFYKEFAVDISEKVRLARQRKQQSYESVKDIALR